MRILTIEQAQAVERPEIIVGNEYEFYAEMLQEYEPADQRMRNYTGQKVTVLRVNEDSDWFEPYEENGELIEPEVSKSFVVRAADGREFCAMIEELNGWDRDLGQYHYPDGTYAGDNMKDKDSMLAAMTTAREAVRNALDAYEGVLEEAMINGPIGQVERKSAEISAAEVECARRVLCMA